MKVNGRYGRFTPKLGQVPYYVKRAKRQEQARKEQATSLQSWLEKYRACANGCGNPVAFYDTVHFTLKHGGCCSPECEQALKEELACGLIP